jgi:hypothetical protein
MILPERQRSLERIRPRIKFFTMLSTVVFSIAYPVPIEDFTTTHACTHLKSKKEMVIKDLSYINKTYGHHCMPDVMQPGSPIGYPNNIIGPGINNYPYPDGDNWYNYKLKDATFGKIDTYIIKPWFDKFALEQMEPLIELIKKQTKLLELLVSIFTFTSLIIIFTAIFTINFK